MITIMYQREGGRHNHGYVEYSESNLSTLESELLTHHKLLIDAHGEGAVTINQHKILRLPEHIRQFGAPSTFSVER
jgi:hypothetical protein